MDLCLYCSLLAWGDIMTPSENIGSLSTEFGVAKKSLLSYALGFVLCIILTVIPFYAVMHQVASKHTLLIILFISAILQFLIQTVCFLRLNFKTEKAKMNVMIFIFIGIVSFIIIGGSIWIMSNLNYFMMH
jgi:cytochrome o ubiquinol oxidase subunit IV